MSDWELKSFEVADAIAGAVVLNLAVRWPPNRRAPTLLLDDQTRKHRYASLTAEIDSEGWLQARYWLPAERLEGPQIKFAIELPDGGLEELPEPTQTRRPARAAVPRAPAPTRRSRRRARRAAPTVRYSWSLRARMAERQMHFTTDLAVPLAERGIALSPAQVHRLVTGTPERLNLMVLAALCDILECTPSDLIECGPATSKT
jgi:DNA-binding Xre family transcriptional regulator